jgi:hypothetical protein
MTRIPGASTTKSRRGRPEDPRLIELDRRLVVIVKDHKPITIRGAFYRAEVLGLVPKEETAVRLVQRRLLKLRRAGIVPYSSIVDESRDVYGFRTYDGLEELADAAASLYRRDYWRDAEEWVQIWIEKRALAGVLSPVVADRWGLNLYVCGGQPSESYLYRAGLDIGHRGVPAVAYVLSDFDPAGSTIFNTLAQGTKGCPGGLGRFTDGVPVEVRRLALDEHQVKAWNLPTRPAKRSDSRAAKFIARHGDVSVELDAIPPTDLRRLVDDAIGRHMPLPRLEMLKLIEADERKLARIALGQCQNTDDPNDDAEGGAA